MVGKFKQPNYWMIGIVAIGLLGTATTAYVVIQENGRKSNINNQTVEVTLKDIVIQVKANGVVQAIRKINLSPKEAGRIAQLYVDEGSRVQSGQLIARMESEQFQAQVNQYRAALAKAQATLAQKRAGNRPEEIAEANARVATAEADFAEAQARLEYATAELRRNQSLAQAGAISQNSLEEFASKGSTAKAAAAAAAARLQEQRNNLAKTRNGTRSEEIAQAEAEVAQAIAQLQFYETQLKNTFIRAPFAGIITRRFAQAGDFVTPTTSASSSDGATSASIAELSSGLEVEAKVPEASIAQIKPEQPVEIRADAYPNQVFTGKVRLVAPTAVKEDNITSIRVKVNLQTGEDTLKSSMNVKLTFLGSTIKNALVVPLAAIVTQKDGQTGVFVADRNNKTQFRPVKLGANSGERVQILKGLSQGELILLSPPEGQVIPGVDTVL